MTRVLLTGATGLIGRHCIEPLLTRGFEVHCISSRAELEVGELAGGVQVRWHRADLLNPGDVQELVSAVQPSHLLHMAWYLEPGTFNHSIENVRWLQASLGLVDAFFQGDGERAVLAGACAEYDWRFGFCSEAVTPLAPATAYGRCKHALHLAFESMASSTELSGAWGRVFFVYGPHEHRSRLVSSLTTALLSGSPARCSHGEQIREYLHVADAGEVTGAVNIASGRPVPVGPVIAGIADRTGGADLIEWGAVPTPPDDTPLIAGDVRLLSDEVGWRPQHDLDTGLDQTVSWRKRHMATEEHP